MRSQAGSIVTAEKVVSRVAYARCGCASVVADSAASGTRFEMLPSSAPFRVSLRVGLCFVLSNVVCIVFVF